MTKKPQPRAHGIGLFSGGLDSTLAVLLLLEQNIKVTALTFLNHFGCEITDRTGCTQNPDSIASKFGFELKAVHLGQKFIDLVKDPPHGYGKNMNPCIDCRILMLREAREYMEMVGADFVFTGEVLGQRPMSQHRAQLNLITRRSGLDDKLLRPLSARLLDPTAPEKEGLVERDKLEKIAGRSRKRQMELAEKYGLDDYPNPAAGCLLTDVGYSRRLKDLLDHRPDIDVEDINLLRVGRHFRLDDATKVVVGRNKGENEKISSFRGKHHWIFEARGAGSPLTLFDGKPNSRNIELAARITARYCDAKNEDSVEVAYDDGESEHTITVAPLDNDSLDEIRI